MGFRVEVDSDKSRILRLLRLNPAEIFGEPYAGYLLFLVGGADEAILTWISDNAVALDSLTGDDIAFAVFARSFRMELHLRSDDRPTGRRVRRRIELPLEDVKAAPSIKSLVRSGRCGWVLDGDEIHAITYAVDDIARAFGVMNDLPCMLVLDAIPRKEFEVFRLNETNIHRLIPLLRRVIPRLLETPTYSTFMATIHQVTRLQEHGDRIQDRIDEAAEERRAISYDSYYRSYQQMLREFRPALISGHLRKITKRRWGDLALVHHRLDDALAAVKENHDLLLTYSWAIDGFRRSLRPQWPLEGFEQSDYLRRYRRYVRKLAKGVPEEPDLTSPEQCEAVTEQLIAQQAQLVDEIMDMLPSTIADIDATAREVVHRKRKQVDTQLGELCEARQKADSELQLAITYLYETEQPSLIRSFAREAREDQLTSVRRQVQQGVKAFAGSWLSPSVIVKVWKLLAGAP